MKNSIILACLFLSNNFLHGTLEKNEHRSGEYEDYTKISQTYDSTRKPIGITIILNALATLPVPLNQQSILDGGCGSGNYLAALENKLKNLVGVDLNSGMLEKARAKLNKASNVSFKQGSLLDIPCPNNSFHGMLVNQVIHHLETAETLNSYDNTRRMIQEASRVLKKDGLLIMNISTHEQLRDGFWFYALIPEGTNILLKRHPSLPDIKDLLLEENFSIQSIITPVDEILQAESYFNPRGPLTKVYRDGDSTWTLAPADELTQALETIQALDKQGTLQSYFDERDALRQRIGQTVFVVAKNNKKE